MARILVADDAATVRMLVSRHLRAAGHEVIEAEDGAAAFEPGLKGDIDLALLDQLMPAMLGTEVIAQVARGRGRIPGAGLDRSRR